MTSKTFRVQPSSLLNVSKVVSEGRGRSMLKKLKDWRRIYIWDPMKYLDMLAQLNKGGVGRLWGLMLSIVSGVDLFI